MGGIASKLMRASQRAMEEVYNAEHVSLHVRAYSNRAAFSLYTQSLGFEIHDLDKKYYADNEDAYVMRRVLTAGKQKAEEAKDKKKAIKDKDKDENKEKDKGKDKDKDNAEKEGGGKVAEEGNKAGSEEIEKPKDAAFNP